MTIKKHEILEFGTGIEVDQIMAALEELPADSTLATVELTTEAWRQPVAWTFRREVTDE